MVSVFIIIIVAIIAIGIWSSARKKEIKDNERSNLVSIWEQRYKASLIGLYISLAILVAGVLILVLTDGIFGEFIGVLILVIGAPFAIGFGIYAASVRKNQLKKYKNMREDEYLKLQESINKEEESLVSNQGNTVNKLNLPFFEKPPVCPYCGSEDTKTSDNYKVKQGAKVLGKLALSAALGNYTNMNMAQRYMMGQNYNKSISVDREYQCKHCGYIWKPEPETSSPASLPSNDTQNKKLETSTIAPNDTSEERTTLINDVQTLKSLLAAGEITQEEYNAALHKILIS